MDNIAEKLALIYAEKKLSEYLLDIRESLACGSTDLSKDELEYLKSAYDFAINNLPK